MLSSVIQIFRGVIIRALSAQDPPDIVIIDEDEFNKRVAEHEVNRLKVKRIKELFSERKEKQ